MIAELCRIFPIRLALSRPPGVIVHRDDSVLSQYYPIFFAAKKERGSVGPLSEVLPTQRDRPRYDSRNSATYHDLMKKHSTTCWDSCTPHSSTFRILLGLQAIAEAFLHPLVQHSLNDRIRVWLITHVSRALRRSRDNRNG